MNAFIAWFRQPTTVVGIATLLGTLSAVLLHQITWVQAIPLMVGGFTGVAVKDNSSTIIHKQNDAADTAAATSAQGGPIAMHLGVLLLFCGFLSACGGKPGAPVASSPGTSFTYAQVVGMLQTDYPQLKAAAAAYVASPGADPKIVAQIASAEAKADADVAKLSGFTAPATLTAAMQDVTPLLAVPGLGISPTTRADVTLGLSIASILVQTVAAL